MARIGKFTIESAALSDIGRQRQNNEDALLALDGHGVFCVADGVGGSERSELASQAVVHELQTAFDEPSPTGLDTVTRDLEALTRTAIDRASRWIHERAGHVETAGMASTVVVLIIRGAGSDAALTLHAGDSRCYRLRADALQLLTRDHSGAEMIGIRDEKLVPEHYRHLITRAVGTHPRVNLEHTAVDIRGGDLFLLCSDGLNSMVSDDHLHSILSGGCRGNLQALAKSLVQAANDAGGADNISVLLVRLHAAESRSSP